MENSQDIIVLWEKYLLEAREYVRGIERRQTSREDTREVETGRTHKGGKPGDEREVIDWQRPRRSPRTSV